MIDMRIKTMFFDRPKVQRAMNAAQRRSLSRGGAFIRTRARTSMRRRKGTSKPGQPPHAHEGSLRRLILFGYDRAHNSVVVGPVGFAKSKAPRVLEFGGRARIIRRRRGKRESRTTTIAARPYMKPALEKEVPNLPKVWHNSVRGGQSGVSTTFSSSP